MNCMSFIIIHRKGYLKVLGLFQLQAALWTHIYGGRLGSHYYYCISRANVVVSCITGFKMIMIGKQESVIVNILALPRLQIVA